MTSKLTKFDLAERIDAYPNILFDGVDDGYIQDDTYRIELKNAEKRIDTLSVAEFMSEYQVDKGVAERFYTYQNDVLKQLHVEIKNTLHHESRYLDLKDYVNDKKYDKQMISDFIEYDFSEVNFQKEYSPRRFLTIRLLSLTISYSILISTVAAGFFGFFSIEKDLIFYSLVFIMWLMINIQFMISTPKDYRTRKLLYNMKSKYNFLKTD
jgi:hypothetical protein